MSPTILKIGPYRFYFYSGDGSEPYHIHIERDEKVAKFWLNPVRMQNSGGFRPAELRRIQSLVEENQTELMESWDDYFND